MDKKIRCFLKIINLQSNTYFQNKFTRPVSYTSPTRVNNFENKTNQISRFKFEILFSQTENTFVSRCALEALGNVRTHRFTVANTRQEN